jgi:hypothetical protein
MTLEFSTCRYFEGYKKSFVRRCGALNLPRRTPHLDLLAPTQFVLPILFELRQRTRGTDDLPSQEDRESILWLDSQLPLHRS